ncbi:hypothetical protein [Pseudoneobacillus rhizosphaerae]|uniref:Uncharacterized protein n=1 Tax=Pseudoneobacillus rhizosphaerae TaxID=2880968 RepID=A0A9C7G9F3_9BACI|nr:hypothetical protein [Pseudoneobacillus rhizosphaerae]CAG9608033.1 hypothetical protein NEOCIP111885_01725 [Pseudoneobacillus rhizosphaerae]
MPFKEAIKMQLKEYKEMMKSPYFWVFYIISITLLFYFDVLE